MIDKIPKGLNCNNHTLRRPMPHNPGAINSLPVGQIEHSTGSKNIALILVGYAVISSAPILSADGLSIKVSLFFSANRETESVI